MTGKPCCCWCGGVPDVLPKACWHEAPAQQQSRFWGCGNCSPFIVRIPIEDVGPITHASSDATSSKSCTVCIAIIVLSICVPTSSRRKEISFPVRKPLARATSLSRWTIFLFLCKKRDVASNEVSLSTGITSPCGSKFLNDLKPPG